MSISNLGTLNGARGLNGFVGATNSLDQINFSLRASGSLNLLLDGLSADADLVLYRQSGSSLIEVGRSKQDGITPDSVNLNNLAAGNYTLLVDPFGAANTNYRLSLTADYAAPVRDLGPLTGATYTETDFVGAGDPIDTYRFSLTAPNRLNLSLTDITANATLRLIQDTNANGILDAVDSIVATSAAAGLAPESINRLTAAGTYFAQVISAGGNTNYNLRLSTTNPSNLIAEEANLGVLGPAPITRVNAVGNPDTSDIYRFGLNGVTNNLNVALSGLTANADVRVIRDINNNSVVDAGEVVSFSNLAGASAESINLSGLAAGNYFVQVYQTAGNTNYTLELSNANPNNLVTFEDLGALGNIPTTRNNFVGAPDTSDIYRFNLAALTNNLNVALSGLTANADVRVIRDANNNGVVDAGEVVSFSNLAGASAESINLSGLAAGNYYVQVYQTAGNTNYTLELSNSSPNNLITFDDLGALGNIPTVRNNFVGAPDTSDFYRFNLAAVTNNLNVALSGLTANADVRVIRDINNNGVVDAGEVVSFSNLGGASAESINLSGLAAGNYFVQVYQTAGNTNYTLELSNSRPNNLITFDALGALGNVPITRNNFVGAVDTSDIYSFNLAGVTNNLNVALSGLTANADVRVIRDANNNGVVDAGEVISFSNLAGASAESINLSGLAAGNYYVQVYQTAGNTNYSLQLSNSSPNNLVTFEELGALGNLPTVRNNFVGLADTSDIYRFNLAGVTNNLNVALSGLTANADVRVIRDINNNGVVDAGEVISFSNLGGASAEAINLSGLAAGNYFVQVYQTAGNTNYTLELSNSNPNNLITFEELGALGDTPTVRNNFVGNSDTSDSYRFTLNGISNNLDIALTGLTADADVRVIRDINNNGVVDAGEVIAFSETDGLSAESINLTGLSAGNYFVQVYQFSGNTNYSLSLSSPNPNSLGTFEDLGLLSATPTSTTNSVTGTDPRDIYRVALNGVTNNLNVALTGLAANADVSVVRDINNNGVADAGEVIAVSNIAGTSAESINLSGLSAGNYFVLVDQGSGNTNYTLELSSANPNNLVTFSDLGTLSGTPTTVANSVSNLNTSDIYRFTVDAFSNTFSAALTGLTADADLRLIRDINNNGIFEAGIDDIVISGQDGTAPEGLSGSIQPGTYFVQVYQFNGNTSYNLSLSV